VNGDQRALGANERLQCCRYAPGERFAPHYDGCCRRSRVEESLLTFIVYLNEGSRGGATDFLGTGVQVTPKTGLALLFQQWQLREGCVVEAGVKYALRSDLMFLRGA
jgi:hypothetical protein